MAKTGKTTREQNDNSLLFMGRWNLDISGSEGAPKARLSILSYGIHSATTVEDAVRRYAKRHDLSISYGSRNADVQHFVSGYDEPSTIVITSPALISALLDNKAALKLYKSKDPSRKIGQIKLNVDSDILPAQGTLYQPPTKLMAFLDTCGIDRETAAYFKPSQEHVARQVLDSLAPATDERQASQKYTPEAIERRHTSRKKQIIRLCGFERHDNPDYEAVVHLLNRESGLGLNLFQEQVAVLMMTALSKGDRFAGSPYLSAKKGENAAKHSAHAVLKWDNLFERSGVLCSGSEAERAKAEQMRQTGALATLVHDWGEVLGEASTVDNRVLKGQIHDNGRGAIEARICEYAMRLAAHAIETGDVKKDFYDKIEALKKKADVKHHGYEIAEKLIAEPDSIPLSDKHQKAIGVLKQHLEYAELEKDVRDFRCWLIKGVEHLEGTRHLKKFGKRVQGIRQDAAGEWKETGKPFIERARKAKLIEKKPKDIPLVTDDVIVDSLMSTTSFFYNERELGYLWQKALQSGDPMELALARQHSLDVYQTMVEFLDAKPAVFRGVNPEAMSREERDDFKHKIKKKAPSETFASLIKEVRGANDGPYPVTTRARVRSIYRAAIELMEDGQFHPLPGEVLLETGITRKLEGESPYWSNHHGAGGTPLAR